MPSANRKKTAAPFRDALRTPQPATGSVFHFNERELSIGVPSGHQITHGKNVQAALRRKCRVVPGSQDAGFMNGLRFRAGQGYRVPQALLENAARLAQEHLSAVVRATAVSLQRAAVLSWRYGSERRSQLCQDITMVDLYLRLVVLVSSTEGPL